MITRAQTVVLAIVLMSGVCFAQEQAGALQGQVVDPLGGVLIDTPVTLIYASGFQISTRTDQQGTFVFSSVAPGRYKVRVSAPGFALYEDKSVDVRLERRTVLQVRLRVAQSTQEVTVTTDLRPLDLENRATTMVFRGKALESLPEGPGGLAATLALLSVRSASAAGPEIIVNGFAGGLIPPKSSIREIRVNQNPFSAQYDQPGVGRVEILTEPGTDTLRGGVYHYFNDESLNSRNPFAPSRAPFQSRLYGGNLGGPVVPKRVSFFTDFERRENDDNAVVNATVLDTNLNVTPFNVALLTPQRRSSFSTRLDYQVNPANTLAIRYADSRARSSNLGVGEFSLPSRAYDRRDLNQTIQLTETAALGHSIINELRFQYVRDDGHKNAASTLPAIRVDEAFVDGGSEIGVYFHRDDKIEVQNQTMWTSANHVLRTGGHLRYVQVLDSSPWNFHGTFTFAGRLAPQLNSAGQVVNGADGLPVITPISTLESYRRTLFFQQQHLSPDQIRALGGGPSQFSIAAGNPETTVDQYDAGVFIQDDWTLRPHFTLSSGLRYEAQSNIHNDLSLAPRLAFAWTPARRNPKLVFRGGAGIFYDRLSQDLILQAKRLDGTNQRQYVVTDAQVLDRFPDVLPAETLSSFLAPTTITRIADTVRAPYMVQTNFSMERELPFGLSTAVTYVNSRSLHVLRSRNTNAPLPGTSTRPVAGLGEVFQYETSGRSDQHQLIVNVVQRLGKKGSYYATYVFNRATNDTDGPGSFPADSYNLAAERGRSAQDIRHTFYWGGWLTGPLNIELSPVVVMRSGAPFNITTGRDTNGDNLFFERPAFAIGASTPETVVTPFGTFGLSPQPGQTVIPRNFGQGPGFASVHLKVSRTFNLNAEHNAKRKYPLTLSVQVQNLFNRTNTDVPVGNLSSPLFGHSYSSVGDYGFGDNSAGNRRIEAQIYLGF